MTARQPRDVKLTCEQCGYVTTLTTRGTAEYTLRKHSCDNQLARTARLLRVEARITAEGPKRPCHHKIAQHQHGTRACYVLDRCRCRPCREANRNIERIRSRERLYGRWQPYVDAQPARDHILALRAQGLGPKLIARAADVPHGSLAKIVYGDPQRGLAPSKRIRPDTERKILAVTADLVTLGSRVGIPAAGTHRRIQALVWLGWSQSKIGAHIGITPGNFAAMMRRQRVGPRTAAKVIAVYDELRNTPPPEATHRDKIAASRARNYARAHDWKPPMWWSEEELDALAPVADDAPPVDDSPDVDDVAIERAIKGEPVTLTRDERLEVVRRMASRGATTTDIAGALRCSGDTARQLLTRLDQAGAA